MPAHRKSSILRGIAARLGERREELARLMALESGKPIALARGEVDRAVTTFLLGADEALRLGGEVVPTDIQPGGEGRLALYRRVPRGVVAAIAPFNFPLNLVAHKLSPAIAAGCSVVLKPPPQAPLTSHVLGTIAAESGLPGGCLNIVHCDPDVAQRMVEDERIAVLSFTGSDTVGWKLRDVARKKSVLLELGGNAPCVIDEGTDIDRIMDRLMVGAWAYGGQVCIKAQRFIVHEALYDRFVDAFVQATRGVQSGDPLDEDTLVGPLIEERHVERVLSWVREAEQAGARVHCGAHAEGSVVFPTVLTDVPDDARVVRDEVFGPVAVIERVESFGAALQACNRTRFGLQAGIFTPRLDHALRAFEELRYGGVLVNDIPTFRVDNYPYGGTKDSGLGREGVASAVVELTEPRMLILKA
jgi:acyl-CoA reductase-like NAD-dependent aldehyde dehydrogenase